MFKVDSGTPSNMVTTDTTQTISGEKTFSTATKNTGGGYYATAAGQGMSFSGSSTIVGPGTGGTLYLQDAAGTNFLTLSNAGGVVTTLAVKTESVGVGNSAGSLRGMSGSGSNLLINCINGGSVIIQESSGGVDFVTITQTAFAPGVDEASSLGSASKRWAYAYFAGVKDNAENIRLGTAGNTGTSVQGAVADGGTAIGVRFANINALSNSAAKIAAFYNDSFTTEKLALYADGRLGFDATVAGTATLVGGTVTVSTASVRATSKILLTCNTPGGTQGFLSAPVASIVAATSFVINSSSGTDTSTVNWFIFN